MASKKSKCSIASVIIFALHVIMCSMSSAKPYGSSDQISKLPGQPTVTFKQYSGYVNVDEKHETQRSYFYYFVEAENDPGSKPLALWLFGGPGCSSLGIGAFTGNGPFKPRGTNLERNEYSWNKVANMLYLESPAGVGFSYSVDASFYNSVNDTITAADNFMFLNKWLEKYPLYMNRSLYITGESYIGHYATQLAALIIKSKSKIFNLKGIGLGNPLLEFKTDYNGRAEYMWSHGMISDSTYKLLDSVCNYSRIMHQTITNSSTPECSRVKDQLTSEIGRNVSIYDVPKDVCSLGSPPKQSNSDDEDDDDDDDDDQPKADITCVIDDLTAYLRRKDVQKALHAKLVGVSQWNICSIVMHYDMRNLEVSMIGLLRSVVKSGIQVLAYSGDQDAFFPLAGTRKMIDRVANDLRLKKTRLYRPWIAYNEVAGWSQGYGSNNNLSFATVRGGSHDAPYSQPERSFALFSSFISGKSLPLPPG